VHRTTNPPVADLVWLRWGDTPFEFAIKRSTNAHFASDVRFMKAIDVEKHCCSLHGGTCGSFLHDPIPCVHVKAPIPYSGDTNSHYRALHVCMVRVTGAQSSIMHEPHNGVLWLSRQCLSCAPHAAISPSRFSSCQYAYVTVTAK
jgi:hypothetical protein